MGLRGTETEFELTTIERLERLGYGYRPGPDLQRPLTEVVLRDELRGHLRSQYPDLPAAALEEAFRRFSRPDGVNTLRRNQNFHLDLTRGFEVEADQPDGPPTHKHLYAVDWEHPGNNRFLAVNQFSIRGRNDRRPDIVVFINGLPLAVFELKSPFLDKPTVQHAWNQIAHYRNDIPQLFEFNAVTVVSDGANTLHGMWPSSMEWFAPWKSIDGLKVEAGTTGGMKTLIEGLFPKDRLLTYIRHFIVFDEVHEKIVKKGARYHQFFAVQLAAERALQAVQSDADRRIGVIWHTTGSGKSLSMVFLVAMLRRWTELENPTFVIQVDRNDLDEQLTDQFLAARTLVGRVKQARSVDHLRRMLQTEGGEVILTTIEKFQLKEDAQGRRETRHPVLSERSNIIVIADEAHRSQYGFLKGFARYLNEALPNARRIGFTGTPVSFGGADTVEVFGDYIHTYDIRQSQLDGTTVPIYYTPRLVKLHLAQLDVDQVLDELTEGYETSEVERKKSRWAALAEAAGARERLDQLARDLLDHFRKRTETLKGKALVVCMSRRNCVRLYDVLTGLPGCPEVKVVMTGDLGSDPKEWSQAGHITTREQREGVKERMRDLDDPLAITIVCDMWLTGTDIPCLHTLYVDKPMKGHNIIQAISRVNRVFRDKPHGLIVDYIGIGDQLREATRTYTAGGGQGEPAPEVSEKALPLFMEHLDEVRRCLPSQAEYRRWRELSGIEHEDLCSLVYGYLLEFDERRDHFLQAEHRLSRSYLLVKHEDAVQPYADEVIFFQHIRSQLLKTTGRDGRRFDLEGAVRDLVDQSVEAEGVFDIFAAAGIEDVDISILNEKFLQTFKHQPHQNLRLRLLEKLLKEEIRKREAKNLVKSRSFKELLEETLRKYHNRLIDAATVIAAMIEIRREMERDDRRAEQLGLEEDELAFYDAVAANLETIYDQRSLCLLIHDVVQSIKRNLKVDWTQPHREDVKAAIRAAVKRVLRTNGVQPAELNRLVPKIMEQAESLFRDWPRVA